MIETDQKDSQFVVMAKKQCWIVWGFGCLLFFVIIATTAFAELSVDFSMESGFYNKPFLLSMNSEYGEIYYTLDGSKPNNHSIHYEGPILIEDATKNINKYCMYDDVCLELKESKDVSLYNKHGYHIPVSQIDKTTIVRAVAIDNANNISEETSAVYFVGYDEKKGYNVFIMTITTDPINLFDSETGIYVLGNCFNESVKDNKLPLTLNWGWWPANYTQRGRNWEREASVFLFDQHRNLILTGNFGVRIQGGSSRGLLPKSLNLFSRKEYGINSSFSEINNLFNWNACSITLYSGAHSMQTKLNDYLVNSLCKDLEITTRTFIPIALFLDGEYWGFYWLTPRYEKEFFQAKYNINKNEIIEIKNGYIEVGENIDLDTYLDMKEYIISHDMCEADNYQKAKKLIDINSYIDYYALEIYIANMDWPRNNYNLWRTRYRQTGKYTDTRWRWIVYDVNLSMNTKEAATDSVQRAINMDAMFASLMENDEFKSLFFNRLIELACNHLNPVRINHFINDYENKMCDVMRNEYVRFRGSQAIDLFIDGCEDIRDFFALRYDYIMGKYGEQN